ncbi:hypothetical protein LTR28_010067 [Elasticomyces elasticus]|nr:hypothetical protein LTR28_010067 [Elasticomyces elasticus]KAK4992442.1 Peroxisome chaperone and import receptor [Elasticomyces elasticus]
MAEKEPHEIEDAPDPDEDDLDDLDDVLDEFSATKIEDPKASTTAPSASGPGRPSLPADQVTTSEEDDFARQMQAGMAELLGQLDSNPEMQKHFENIMKDLGGGGDGTQDAPTTASPAAAQSQKPATQAQSAAAAEDSFQETIRKTMERMQTSGQAAGAAAASAPEDDLLAQMLREMESGNFPGGGGEGGVGGEEDFNKMLLGMMEQLTNKEILYEPMKELHDKFPAWMREHRAKVAREDLERYEEQQRLVGEIVGRFERAGYSDDNTADREFIVERMQKMQAAGSPPPDLVGDMSAAQEALGGLEDGCPQQ